MLNKASVVIPVYNGYKWSEGIIRSISGNLGEVGELILVNDGDEADFKKLTEALQANLDLPVTAVNTSGRQGPAVARNLGIDRATCEYIAFLDCDDIWLPESLKKRISLLVNHPRAPFAYSSWQYISETGYPLNEYLLPAVTALEQLLVTNYLALPSVVIRARDLGDQRFPRIGHEDYGLWLDLLKRGPTDAVGMTEVGLQVRRVAGSASSNKKKALQWHWNILKNFGVPFIVRGPLFMGYAVNAILKRKFKFSHPVFLGLDRLARLWLAKCSP